MIFSKDRSANRDLSFQTIKTRHRKKTKNKKKQKQKKNKKQRMNHCFFMTEHLNRDKNT